MIHDLPHLRQPAALLGAVALLTVAACAQPGTGQVGGNPTVAKNVILVIGDGMDDHQLAIARNYLKGPGGAFSFEDMAIRGAARVLTVQEFDPEVPEYVADSASSGTALAAGVVTSRGRISTTAGADEDVETILERAQKAGLRTGLVATSAITDATPAVFAAHTNFRFCEGPDDMGGSMGGIRPGCPRDLKSAGGLGSIAEQLVDRGVDVLFGGGLESFEETTPEGPEVLALAAEAGYGVAKTEAELQSLAAGAPALGLFGDGTLPVAWAGEGGKSAVATELGTEPDSFACTDNSGFKGTPRLRDMTAKAIELLSADDDGFFLMVESASIDKQAHAANPCGQIGETLQLEEAVEVARAFAVDNPDTLIIITADHGHSGQIIPYPSLFAAMTPVLGKQGSPGKVALLELKSGGRMAVSYGTNESQIEEHTGTHVPIFAEGPGAEAVSGLVSQTDIHDAMVAALGLE